MVIFLGSFCLFGRSRMDELCSFRLEDLYERLSWSDSCFVEWFQHLRLLHSKRTCSCGADMKRRSSKKGNTFGAWRCTSRRCSKEKGFLIGTFFEGVHISLKEFLQLAYFWSRKTMTVNETIFQIANRNDNETMSPETVIDWNNYFRGMFTFSNLLIKFLINQFCDYRCLRRIFHQTSDPSWRSWKRSSNR